MKILTFTKLKDSLDKLFKEKKTKWLVIVGIAGIVLIMLGDFLGSPSKKTPSSSELQFDNDAYNIQYVEKLQKDLTEFISKIEGVGAVEVLVTLETGVQYVYATNTKSSDDSSYTSDDKQSQKWSQESNIIIVDGAGGKEPLVLKRIEPVVQGVVVVCGGADNIKVKEAVIEAVTTLCGIGSNRVSVTKMAIQA